MSQVLSEESSFQFRRAVTRSDLDAVARLRYQVYVAELGRSQPHADHAAQSLLEPLDHSSIVLVAQTEAVEVVGTLRLSSSDAQEIESPEIYGWEERRACFPGAVFLASKFMVAPHLRGTRLGVALILQAAAEARSRGWRFGFLETYDELVPLYRRTGFCMRRSVLDPVYGRVSIMEIDLLDFAHLERVQSPLASVLAVAS